MNRMNRARPRNTVAPRPKRRVRVFWGVVLLLAILVYRTLLQSFDLPPQGVRLKVPRGSSWISVAEQLAEQNFITSALSLRVWLMLRPGEEVLRSGVFILRPPMTLDQLVQRLAEAPDGTQPLVLIEGERFKDLRKKLAAREDLRQSMTTLTDAEVLGAIGADEKHPEGLFAPNTYVLEEGERDLDILRRLYQRQKRILAEEWAARQSGLPYSNAYEALIMASIIEKETGAASERAQIAGVFVRRLQVGMRLQTDPTVIYGVGERYKGDITRAHLREDSPYNTYRRAGLPPTPIANPGRAAIHAALHPAEGDALYFVAGSDGHHVFSANLADHNRAVNRYQR
ncbi:MAG: endolytic transglycosylase MltG [Pseudomonadota bacterium]